MAKRKKHMHLDICERQSKDGYSRCRTCKGKVALVCLRGNWVADQEPFKADEHFKHLPKSEQDLLGYDGAEFEIHDEISGHYCPRCNKLVSFSFNEC